MKELSLQDFTAYDDEAYEVEVELWGVTFPISVECKHAQDGTLKDSLSRIQNILQWTEDNKQQILETLCDEMLEDANDWTEGCDTKEIDGVTYYETDIDEYITLPVTKEQFLSSLYFNSAGIDIYNDTEESFDIYIDTKPNYFGHHSIMIVIDETRDLLIKLVG